MPEAGRARCVRGGVVEKFYEHAGVPPVWNFPGQELARCRGAWPRFRSSNPEFFYRFFTEHA